MSNEFLESQLDLCSLPTNIESDRRAARLASTPRHRSAKSAEAIKRRDAAQCVRSFFSQLALGLVLLRPDRPAGCQRLTLQKRVWNAWNSTRVLNFCVGITTEDCTPCGFERSGQLGSDGPEQFRSNGPCRYPWRPRQYSLLLERQPAAPLRTRTDSEDRLHPTSPCARCGS